MSKLDIQGKLKINSSGILELNGNPYVDFNAAGQLALGNQDWLPLCGETTYLSHPGSSQADAQGTVSSVYFDYNAGGMKFVGQGTVHIQTRIPVDKFSKYRIKVRVKKTVQAQNTITTPSAKTDLDYFYCGVSNYDSDHVSKFTDSATTYNYGVALAQPLYEDGSITSNTSSHPGHGTTGNSDGEYVFENTISGLNLASEGDHTKFDPGTSYFNIVIICNYIGFGAGTSDLTEAIKGETIIQSLEVERVSSWGGNDIDSPADTPSYFSHPAQQYYPGSMPTDYDSSWDGLVQMAARGSWVEGDASGSKDGRGWAFWPASGQGSPTLFIQEQKSNTPTELGKPGNMNYPAGIAGEKNESIRNVPLWLVGQYEQGDLLVGSNHPVARFQQNYTIPSRTSPNGDYIDINVVGYADDSLSSVDYAGMGIESGLGNLFLGSRNIHKQSDGGTYFPELTSGSARNEWGMIIDMKNLVHIGIPSGVDEGNWRRMDVAYGREVLNLHGAAKFTSITGPRAGSGSQGAGTLWWRDDTGPGAFYYRAPDGTDKVLGNGDVTFNYSGTLWEGYNADRIGTDNTVHFSKTSLNQLDLNPAYYNSTSTAGMALGCGWGQSDGVNRPAIQIASSADSGWAAIYLNKTDVTGPNQSGNDTRYIQFGVNGDNPTSFRSSGSDGKDFQIQSSQQISLSATDGVAVSDSVTPKQAYSILDVEGSNGDQGGQLYVSSTEDPARDNGGGILFGAKVSASNRALTGSIHGVKSNDTDGDYKGDLIFTTRSGSAGTTNDIFQNESIMPERMRIRHDGAVSIGKRLAGLEDGASAKLQINNSSNAIYYANGKEPTIGEYAVSAINAYDGGLVAGTSCGYQFTVYGGDHINGASQNSVAGINLVVEEDNKAGGALTFIAAPDSANRPESMRITSQGVVGIGTKTPFADVAGWEDRSGALHIQGAQPRLRLQDDEPASDGAWDIVNHGGDLFFQSRQFDGSGNFVDDSQANKIKITQGGNVGIGTDSPSAPLEISTTSDEAVRINQGAGAPWNYLSFYQQDQFKGYVGTVGSDDSDLDGGLTLTALAGENLYLRTAPGSGANTDNRITVLNSNGNVGIGYFTSSAPPTRTLDVNGDINFSGNIYQNGSMVSFDTAAGGGSGALWSAGGGGLYYNGGNVGIGTTSPEEPLDVRGVIKTKNDNDDSEVKLVSSGGMPYINLQRGDSALGDWKLTAKGNGSQQVLATSVGTSELMTVQGNGNVGIGTTSPEEVLHIKSTSPIIKLTDTNTNVSSLLHADTGMGSLIFVADSTGGGTDPFISFRTQGTSIDYEKLRITDSGNVGIGTTSPSSLLSLFSASAASSVMRIARSTSAANQSNYLLNITEESDNHSTLDMQAANGISAIRLRTSGDSYFNGGNVGVGTTSPDALLHIAQPSTTIGGEDLNNSALLIGSSTQGIGIDDNEIISTGHAGLNIGTYKQTGQAEAYIRFMPAQVEAMRITDDGNVGIGTTSPGYKLHIAGGTPAMKLEGTQPRIWLSENDQTDLNVLIRNAESAFRIDTVSDDDALIANRLTILNTNGNVGIGTTEPDEKLHIDGTVKADRAKLADLDIRSFTEATADVIGDLLPATGTSKFGTIIETDPNGQMIFGIRGNDENDAFRILTKNYVASVTDEASRPYNHAAFCVESNGNVGIGTTSPGYKLDVRGNARIGDSDDITPNEQGTNSHLQINGSGYSGFVSLDADAMHIGHNSNIRDLYLSTNETPRLSITSDGNVGIGTTSASSKLQVAGPIKSTGLTISKTEANTYAGSIQGLNSGLTLSNTVDTDGELQSIGLQFALKTTGNNFTRQSWIGSVQDQPDTRYSSLVFGTDEGTSSQPNRTEKMRISHNGNVGIGTTNPSSKLHVYGTTLLESSNASLSVSADSKIEIKANIEIDDEGETKGIWFGNGAQAKGYIGGGDYAVNGLSANDFAISSSAGNDLAFGIGGTEIMRIKSDGSVGIGTTDPQEKFHVHGTMMLSDTPAPTTTTNKLYANAGKLYWNGSELTGGGTSLWSTLIGGDGTETFAYYNNPTYGENQGDKASGVIIGGANLTSGGSVTQTIQANTDDQGPISHRVFKAGVFIASGAQNPYSMSTAYARLDSQGGSSNYLWFSDSGDLITSTNVNNLAISGAVVGDQTSDERLKDIKPDFGYGLEQVMQLAPIEYSFKSDSESKNRLGFGAQSTQSIIPEAVYDTGNCVDGYEELSESNPDPEPKSDDTTLAMQYVQLIPVLTKAIQELKAENDDLKSRLESIEEWRGNSV
jgi:hypothetical protein